MDKGNMSYVMIVPWRYNWILLEPNDSIYDIYVLET